jgi:hypothetical protein
MCPAFLLKPGEEVNGSRILSPIGSGGFGAIYYAELIATGARYALQLEARTQFLRALRYEHGIYEALRVFRYVPQCKRYFTTDSYVGVAMECLGPSVRSLCQAAASRFRRCCGLGSRACGRCRRCICAGSSTAM